MYNRAIQNFNHTIKKKRQENKQKPKYSKFQSSDSKFKFWSVQAKYGSIGWKKKWWKEGEKRGTGAEDWGEAAMERVRWDVI